MHRSRPGGLIIDCETDDLGAAADFWTRALGYAAANTSHPDDVGYVPLATPADEPHLELQAVSHPSRVHIDIETDDVAAEVARLEKLGATRIAQVRSWWIMQAPSGHRFCVIEASRPDFADRASVWE